MGRDCSKASGNVYFEARKAAAEYDDRLYSREKAAELLGVSVSTLADYENGSFMASKFFPDTVSVPLYFPGRASAGTHTFSHTVLLRSLPRRVCHTH